MKRFKKVILILIMILNVLFIFPADRGLDVLATRLDPGREVGKQYLVIIAINRYDEWFPLRGPMKDALDIKDILLENYYIDELIELYNEDATKRNIIKLFRDLQNKLRTNDSLLVFYAGHGYLDNVTNTGFWIPVDGGVDDLEQDNWLPNTQIRGMITNIKARHVCLIADSCFSGDILDLTRGKPRNIDNEYLSRAYKRISRQVMTSGASETVSDKSTFAKQLKYALEGNSKPYIDTMMIFNEVRLGVRGSTPLYGALKDTGHQDGASFILFRRDKPNKDKIVSKVQPIDNYPIKKDKKIRRRPKKIIVDSSVPKKHYMDFLSGGGPGVYSYQAFGYEGSFPTGSIGLSFGYMYQFLNFFAFGPGVTAYWNISCYYMSGVCLMGQFMFGDLEKRKIAFLFDIGGGWLFSVKAGGYFKGFVLKIGYNLVYKDASILFANIETSHYVSIEIGYKHNFRGIRK